MNQPPADAPTALPKEAVLRVRLYVAGEGPNSVAAIANLRAALAMRDARSTHVEIIDVFEDADRALRDGVLVTPMLIRVEPGPERRILGNLRDRPALLGALRIDDGAK